MRTLYGLEHPFDKIYLDQIVKTQGHFFEDIVGLYPHNNHTRFIEAYFNSDLRCAIDVGHPHFSTRYSHELLEAFIEETGFQFTEDKEDFFHYTDMYWVGCVYALYQWTYCVPSSAAFKYLSPQYMAQIYPAQHCNSLCRTVEDLGPIPEDKMANFGITEKDLEFRFGDIRKPIDPELLNSDDDGFELVWSIEWEKDKIKENKNV